jgi:hypothetical protein
MRFVAVALWALATLACVGVLLIGWLLSYPMRCT